MVQSISPPTQVDLLVTLKILVENVEQKQVQKAGKIDKRNEFVQI